MKKLAIVFLCSLSLSANFSQVFAQSILKSNLIKSFFPFSGIGKPVDLVSGDINLDGKPDLFVLSGSTSNGLSLFLNKTSLLDQTNIQFESPFPFNTVGGKPTGIDMGDLNLDGKADVAYYNGSGFGVYFSNTPSDAISNSQLIFSSGYYHAYTSLESISSIALPYTKVKIFDMDNDSRNDIVIAVGSVGNPLKIIVFLNKTLKGSTDFVFQSYILGTNCISDLEVKIKDMDVADFDGDNFMDFVFAGDQRGKVLFVQNISDVGQPKIAEPCANSSSNQQYRMWPTSDLNIRVGVGELNGDGKIDVSIGVGAGYNDFRSLIRAKNVSTPPAPGEKHGVLSFNSALSGENVITDDQRFTYSKGPVGFLPNNIDLKDLDGDNKQDLVTSLQDTTFLMVTKNTGYAYDGNSVASFSTTSSSMALYTLPGLSPSLASRIADFNLDGAPDVITFGSQGVVANLGLVILRNAHNFQTPSVLGFNPTSGNAGGIIKIWGKNLDNIGTLKLGNTFLTNYKVKFGTGFSGTDTLVAILPIASPNDINGTISIAPGSSATSATFTYSVSKFDSFFPKLAVEGDPITLKGSGLLNISSILLPGGLYVSEFISVKNDEIKFLLPKGASTGIMLLEVFGTQLKCGSNDSILIVPNPQIYKISPVAAKNNSIITFSGINFKGDSLKVYFSGNSVPGIIKYLSPDGRTVSVQMPPFVTSGPVYANLYTNGISFKSINNPEFTFIAPPKIYDFNPKCLKRGDKITITGQNLTSTRKIVSGQTFVDPVSLSPFIGVVFGILGPGNPLVLTSDGGETTSLGMNLQVVDDYAKCLTPLENSFFSGNFFSLHPNPTSSNLLIKFESVLEKDLTIQILSIDGRILSSHFPNIGSDFYLIDEAIINSLNKGVYFLKLSYKGSSQTKLFIKE